LASEFGRLISDHYWLHTRPSGTWKNGGKLSARQRFQAYANEEQEQEQAGYSQTTNFDWS